MAVLYICWCVCLTRVSFAVGFLICPMTNSNHLSDYFSNWSKPTGFTVTIYLQFQDL